MHAGRHAPEWEAVPLTIRLAEPSPRAICMQAIKILNMIKVFGKPIRCNKASTDKTTKDVGANLFIGNLDPDVDEKVRKRGGLTGGGGLFSWWQGMEAYVKTSSITWASMHS